MRCVVLLSGGLDSQLAVRLMQEQGIEVEALNFKTLYACCQNDAARIAHQLGVRLTILSTEDDYLDVIRYPRYGYGRGANPCIDCRTYMCRRARTFMEQVDASFVVTGELIGQRPMSQKRRDLDIIAYHSGLEDLLLRPLSAKALPPTLPEREGWVDREKLYGFTGRGRRELIELAESLGLKDLPTPSTGCALTEYRFSRKVFDLMQHKPSSGMWDFELLKTGRHFRINGQNKVVIGRDETENRQLQYMHELPDACSSARLVPDDYIGADGLLLGPASDDAIQFAGGLLLRYSKRDETTGRSILVMTRNRQYTIEPQLNDNVKQAVTIPAQANHSQ